MKYKFILFLPGYLKAQVENSKNISRTLNPKPELNSYRTTWVPLKSP